MQILGKLKNASTGLDEKNHGDWFLNGIYSSEFKGKRKIMILKFPVKMATAGRSAGKFDGDLEGENVSCLEGPLNLLCITKESDFGRGDPGTAGREN